MIDGVGGVAAWQIRSPGRLLDKMDTESLSEKSFSQSRPAFSIGSIIPLFLGTHRGRCYLGFCGRNAASSLSSADIGKGPFRFGGGGMTCTDDGIRIGAELESVSGLGAPVIFVELIVSSGLMHEPL